MEEDNIMFRARVLRIMLGATAVAILSLSAFPSIPSVTAAGQTATRVSAGLTEEGPLAIEAVAQRLKDPDWNTRLGAAQDLGKAGRAAAAAVPALIEAIDNEGDGVGRVLVVNAIITTLGTIGPDAVAAVPSLTRALDDENSGVRLAAALALGNIGPGLRSPTDAAMTPMVEGLALALRDEDTSVRRAAAESIGAIGAGAMGAIPALVDTLQDSSFVVRNAAISTLKKLGPEAIRGMVEALQSGDEATSKAVVSALGKMGSDVIPALEGALRDGSALVRKAAADALGQMGPKAKDAADGLLDAVGDVDPGVRQAAMAALPKLGIKTQQAVSVLVEALHDDSWLVRQAAAKTLGQMGSEAIYAMDGLVEALTDEERLVRSAALKSMEQLDPDSVSSVVMPKLIGMVDDEDPQVRRRAVVALSGIGTSVEPMVEALMGALGDPDEGVRIEAILALGRLDPVAEDSVASLMGLLEDDSGAVRMAAVTALGSIGTGVVVPLLVERFRLNSWPERLAAASGLEQIAAVSDEVSGIIASITSELQTRVDRLACENEDEVASRRSLQWELRDAIVFTRVGSYARALETLRRVDSALGEVDSKGNAEGDSVGSLLSSIRRREDSDLPDELHMRGGLPNVFAKLERGDDVTIAYFGGSITAWDGWRTMSFEWFERQYPDANIKVVNASLGGTGSLIGAFRADHDLVRHEPDLVFIEFAVNDGGDARSRTTDVLNAMEGIVRKLWTSKPDTDICFVYTLQGNDTSVLRSGAFQNAAAAHERVAEHYGIPTIHMGVHVARMEQAGKLVFASPIEPRGFTADGRLIFTEDGTHPSMPYGHAIYSESVKRSLQEMSTLCMERVHELSVPLMPDNWENAKTIPAHGYAQFEGEWEQLTAADGPRCRRLGDQIYSWFPYLYRTSTPGSSVTVRFKGAYVGIKGMTGPDSTFVSIKIDDGPPKQTCQFTVYSTSDSYGGEPLPKLDDGVHAVTWTVMGDRPDKGGILASYYREGNDLDYRQHPERYADHRFSIGEILVIGEILDQDGNVIE
jgi:HEAT repeat protein/lysophospholipase L1-like esterase